MDGEHGPQKKGHGWRTGLQLLLNRILLPSPLLLTPTLLRARPSHRAQQGVCVPPASRHLEEERRQKEELFILWRLIILCKVLGTDLCFVWLPTLTNSLKGGFTITVLLLCFYEGDQQP